MLFFLTDADRHQDGHASLILQKPRVHLALLCSLTFQKKKKNICLTPELHGNQFLNFTFLLVIVIQLQIPEQALAALEYLQISKHYPITGKGTIKTKQDNKSRRQSDLIYSQSRAPSRIPLPLTTQQFCNMCLMSSMHTYIRNVLSAEKGRFSKLDNKRIFKNNLLLRTNNDFLKKNLPVIKYQICFYLKINNDQLYSQGFIERLK